MQLRVLKSTGFEIHADRKTDKSRLKTPHFQQYKITTHKMVKTLKLVNMAVTELGTILQIFRRWLKAKNQKNN